MNLSKLSALFFGAPAKTAGKRAVKFKTIIKREKVSPGCGWNVLDTEFRDGSDIVVYVTVETDFVKKEGGGI